MNRLVSSKHLESVSDLTLSAPIKQGFIDAFEAVTYETRLRKVLEALFKVRATAREHSKIKPFVDTAERIQSLLDFRLAVVDSVPRRLLLTATFDRPFEPYMRLIWDPLGPLLDLIFCNCEGYVTATDHSFEEYLAWVRSAQIDTDFFYSASGHSVNDMKYLLELERLDRSSPERSSTLIVVSDPEVKARAVRKKHKDASNLLGLEALVALYRLTDFYPPDQPKGDGRFLRLSTQQLLKGWGKSLDPKWEEKLIPEQLRWFREGLDKRAALTSAPAQRADGEGELSDREKKLEDQKRASLNRLKYNPRDIQGGILSDYGDYKEDAREWPAGQVATRVRHGALLLMRIVDAAKARKFIAKLKIPSEAWRGRGGRRSTRRQFTNLAFTRRGLANIGVDQAELARFPQEFHEGMEDRAGLLGDLRQTHPRNWSLPERNWPGARAGRQNPPPVEMSEVDIVIQLRTFDEYDGDDIIGDLNHPLHKEVWRLGEKPELSGVQLLTVQAMRRARPQSSDVLCEDGINHDHFGFRDGFSQPRAVDRTPIRIDDEVARGELLWGYPNDRADPPPPPSDILDNGTFLAVRKLRQHVGALQKFVEAEAQRENICPETLYGKMMGRTRDGDPMLPDETSASNKFGYGRDRFGVNCPFQAHIRRANPRAPREGMTKRPTPRILRRGLSYGQPVEAGKPDTLDRGVVFLAYNASLAEQYEVIQRWVNGGNPTGVGSWLSDPLMGVFEDETGCQVRDHQYGQSGTVVLDAGRTDCKGDHGRTFRFRYWSQEDKPEGYVDDPEDKDLDKKFRTVRVKIPQAFVELQWGTYLFVPSMAAIKTIARWPRNPARAGLASDAAEGAAGEGIVVRLLKQAAEGPDGRR
ncbi:MAG: hypothetical protein ABWX67_07190, partial [Allosphingosinicella sp.]